MRQHKSKRVLRNDYVSIFYRDDLVEILGLTGVITQKRARK